MPADKAPEYGKGWGSNAGAGALFELTCPSGNVCLVRRPGVTGLMQAGVLGDLDILTSLVDKKHVQPNKGGHKKKLQPEKSAAEQAAEFMKDPTKLDAVRRVTLKVAHYMVVRPTVRLHFTEEVGPDSKPVYEDIPEEQRELARSSEYPEDPVIYTDQIDFEDAMFLLQYAVGGTRDLESFRGQFSESLASLESFQNVSDAAKHNISD